MTLARAAGNNKGVTHVWVNNSEAKGGWRVLAKLKGHEGDVVACSWSATREEGTFPSRYPIEEATFRARQRRKRMSSHRKCS